MSSMENQNEKKVQDNNDSSSDECEHLSCLSDKFDPLKALYADKTCVNSEKCRIFDNLASFESSLKRSTMNTMSTNRNTQKKSTLSTQRPQQQSLTMTTNVSDNDSNMLVGRRFLPHQMALQTTGKVRKKHFRNLLLRMKEFDGPLAVLKKYVEEKKKVKIYTRKEKGIRGYIIGHIIAFDVHWNLLLTDAYEIWTRRKYKFSENNAILGQPTNSSSRLKKLGIVLPKINIKSLNRKYVECKRNVSQIMVRGEEVCLIHPIANDD